MHCGSMLDKLAASVHTTCWRGVGGGGRGEKEEQEPHFGSVLGQADHHQCTPPALGPSVWNSLPLHIRNATTIDTKFALKTYILNLKESG